MNRQPHLVGVIDDERNIQATLAAILERHGYKHVAAYNGAQGRQMITEHRPSVVMLDLELPDSHDLELLRKIRAEHPRLPIIVVTAHDSLNNAIESIKVGAYHFISKPYVPEELLSIVSKAIDHLNLQVEAKELREETTRLKKKMLQAESFLEPVFKNQKMVELIELSEQVGPSEANVLLVGESGVGKEVFANLLHSKSARATGPLVKLNCAAFPPNIIEGELFGYKKGAFTGALQDFPGILSAASGGTLFLDEIAEMPIDLQTRFLRVLQEREFRPLGSTHTLKADFRLIAASNQRPDDAIRNGRLREDLFYRLNTFTFHIPPLRERPDDIAALSEQFLGRYGSRLSKTNLMIQPETYKILHRYSWPGNVRELQNVIERAVVLSRNGKITPDNLPPEVLNFNESSVAMSRRNEPPGSGKLPVPDNISSLNLAERERQALIAALEQAHGNKKKAAQILGIHRPTLYTKLRKYGLLS